MSKSISGINKLAALLEQINDVHGIEKVYVHVFSPGSYGTLDIWFKPKAKSRFVVMLGMRAERLKSDSIRITPRAVGSVHISDMPLPSMANILLICNDFAPFVVNIADIESIAASMQIQCNITVD